MGAKETWSARPLLLGAGFRVLLFDLYGFGLSAAPRGRLDLEVYVLQVVFEAFRALNGRWSSSSRAWRLPRRRPAAVLGALERSFLGLWSHGAARAGRRPPGALRGLGA